MADDNTTTTADQPHMIPQSRLDEEASKRKAEREARIAAEKHAAELEARISQLEDRDKGDVERLTKQHEQLQKKLADAEERATAAEAQRAKDQKQALVSNAAAKLNFHDPALAGQLVDLEGIDDAATAERAVKALAKERQYLVRQDAPEAVRLRKVGTDGQTIDPDAEAKQGMVTEEEQRERWGQELKGILTGPNTGAVSGR